MTLTLKLILICALTLCCLTQKLYLHLPTQPQPKVLSTRLSPIGFTPRSGQLDGRLILSSPFNACSPIQNVQSDQEDIFVLVDDQGCLQSIKAKNVLNSGAIVVIMRQNSDTTMHDREINIVHIPVVELQQEDFDKLVETVKQAQEQNVSITATMQFGTQTPLTDITTQLWMSPTQTQAYSFIINMQKFLNNQQNQVTFTPRYAMHSQKQRKSFIGCYSNGLYCPAELQFDGRIQGQNIIQQSLRQIIIREMGMGTWWRYIKYYYVQCLHNEQDVFNSFKSLTTCTRNSMLLAGIDYDEIERQVGLSFLGDRKEVDDNLWLRQERQDYIKEKITQYPVLLINKKQLTSFNEHETKLTICKLESNRSIECSQLLDGSLKSSQLFIILGMVLVIVVFILVGYKYVMYRRMQKEMKTQVTSTLQQYYRYMETLEGQSEGEHPKIYPRSKPQSFNQIQRENKQAQEREEPPEIQIQMTHTRPQAKPKSSKEGHEHLVQEENN